MTELSLGKDTKVVRLLKVNSVDFVSRVFNCYKKHQVFMVDGDGDSSNARSIDFKYEVVRPDEGGGWFEFPLEKDLSDKLAQIVFSSGTEGTPKGIVISYRSLTNVVDRINNKMQVTSEIREYIGVPVTYSFGLGRCRAIASAGGKGFIPENGFNLQEIARMLEAGEINAISAVPSLWRIVLTNPETLAPTADRVKWIEIGSQYMSADEKRQMKNLFPNAHIVQHYGLTEASRSTLLDISHVAETKLESVGPVSESGIEIRLDDESRIQIRGEHLALGKISAHSIAPLTNTEGWLTTSDRGRIEDGYLYYEGRADDIINCSGIKVDPELLQQKINRQLAGTLTVAVAGIKNSSRGEGFLIALDVPDFDEKEIRSIVNKHLNALNITANDAVKIQYIQEIPKTETGKIKRKELARLYKPLTQPGQNITAPKDTLLHVYQSVFSSQTVTADSSFESLGGDSLSYVQISIGLEKILGHIPDNWESRAINNLEIDKVSRSLHWSKIEASIFLRVVAIIFVVLSHSGLALVGGGTHLLTILVGHNFSRFQFKELVNGRIWSVIGKYAIKILIPYYILAVVFSLITGIIDPSIFFMYQNMVGVQWTIAFPFWFVQVIMQCLLIIGLVFSVPFLRNLIKNYSWLISFLALLSFMFIWVTSPTDFYRFTSTSVVRYFALFGLGWTLYRAEKPYEKLLTVLAGLAFAYYDVGLAKTTVWVIIGCVLLPTIKSIYLPRLFTWTANYIAAATFYIFIFNGLAIFTLQHFNLDSLVTNFICAMLLSLTLWLLLDQLNLPRRLFLRFLKKPTLIGS